MSKVLPAMAVIVVLALSGCHTVGAHGYVAAPAQVLVADRLFFGRTVPAGGKVSDAEWEQFLRTVVTPRFPRGLTIWQGQGQWVDPRGDLVRETVFVVEVFHQKSEEAEASIAAIAAEYKKQFGQDAVLRVTSGSAVRFY